MSINNADDTDDIKVSLGVSPFASMAKNISNFADGMTGFNDAINSSMANMMIGCGGNNNWWGGGVVGQCATCNAPFGSCVCGVVYPPNPNPGYIGGGSFTWNGIGAVVLTKGKGKADILGDFFGPEVHALVILDEADGGARFIPFMDKFNMVWLQDSSNSWAAYDRDEFLRWVQSEETVFATPKLKKEEVLKRLAKPSKPCQ